MLQSCRVLVWMQEGETARGRYPSGLRERLNRSWDVQGSVAEK